MADPRIKPGVIAAIVTFGVFSEAGSATTVTIGVFSDWCPWEAIAMTWAFTRHTAKSPDRKDTRRDSHPPTSE
jgi:hypothetical protein